MFMYVSLSRYPKLAPLSVPHSSLQFYALINPALSPTPALAEHIAHPPMTLKEDRPVVSISTSLPDPPPKLLFYLIMTPRPSSNFT